MRERMRGKYTQFVFIDWARERHQFLHWRTLFQLWNHFCHNSMLIIVQMCKFRQPIVISSAVWRLHATHTQFNLCSVALRLSFFYLSFFSSLSLFFFILFQSSACTSPNWTSIRKQPTPSTPKHLSNKRICLLFIELRSKWGEIKEGSGFCSFVLLTFHYFIFVFYIHSFDRSFVHFIKLLCSFSQLFSLYSLSASI